MTFSAYLRAERARLGLTQLQLAQLLNVSFECVSKWERDLSIPATIAQEGAKARLSKQSNHKTN